MKVLVVSDIHGNLTALETVLQDAGQFDVVWCLGDLVGYGPDPNECVERVRALPGLQCVLGNHDAAALKQINLSAFNPEARKSLVWLIGRLSAESRAFLDSLPERLEVGEVTLVHGSPRRPVWEYILDNLTATANFKAFSTPYCFVGHTHLPVEYHLNKGQRLAMTAYVEAGSVLELQPRVIINPGSVGQPRDRDPRASYALFNAETRTWDQRRVEYDIASVQERMRTYNLPQRHIDRLEGGW